MYILYVHKIKSKHDLVLKFSYIVVSIRILKCYIFNELGVKNQKNHGDII